MAGEAMKAVGVSGVVQYGGVLYSDDYDRAWRGTERDRTIRAMVNDPLIGSILHGVEMILRRVDWYVQPADEDDATAVEVAEFVQHALDDMDGMWPGDTISDMLTYIAYGYSVLEVVYKQRTTELHGDQRIGWRGWYARPQTTRDGWVFTPDGEVIAFRQRNPQTYTLIDIPLEKCIYLTYQSSDGSPEGRTPLRAAYDAWYYKRQIQRIEGIGIERDLAGLPVLRVPASDITNNTATYQMAQTIVTSIRNDAMGGLVLASDRDQNGNLLQEFSLVSTGGQRSFDTDTIIRRYAGEIVGVFLANLLRVGQDATGSFALSNTLSDLWMASLGVHLDIIGNAINQQAIRPLVAMNGWGEEYIPAIRHGDVESADLERLGAYLTQLSNAGILVDTPALRTFAHELAGLPVPEEDVLIEQMESDRAATEAARAAAAEALNQQSEDQPDDTEDDAPEDETDGA